MAAGCGMYKRYQRLQGCDVGRKQKYGCGQAPEPRTLYRTATDDACRHATLRHLSSSVSEFYINRTMQTHSPSPYSPSRPLPLPSLPTPRPTPTSTLANSAYPALWTEIYARWCCDTSTAYSGVSPALIQYASASGHLRGRAPVSCAPAVRTVANT